MTKLSVNINKIAVLRNSRGGNMPDVTAAALRIEGYGAEGITVHPRPDQRHIRYADVRALAPRLGVEFNIEGNPVPSFITLVGEVHPSQVTLVPDAPDAITSNAGWDTLRHRDFLTDVCALFRSQGIRTSIFINPDPAMAEGAARCGADRVELYTEAYASAYAVAAATTLAAASLDPSSKDVAAACHATSSAMRSHGRAVFESARASAVAPYVAAAEEAHNCGLGVNAGHDLNLQNLAYFIRRIPFCDEVSIGHALVSDALWYGMENTVQLYKRAIADGLAASKNRDDLF